MTNVQAISPMMAKLIVPQQAQAPQKEQAVQVQKQEVMAFSPLLAQTLLAQNKQILAPQALLSVNATEAQKRVPQYKNELKDLPERHFNIKERSI